MVLHTNSADYPISVIGDINGDGKLNQIDLSSEIRHMVGLKAYQLSGVKKVSADITLDGKVDQRDLTRDIKCLVSEKLDIGKDDIKDTIAPTVTLKKSEISTNFATIEANSTDDVSMPEKPVYTFYLKEKDGNYEQVQESEKSTYTATELKANTEYAIKVTTKDEAGNTGSNEITFTTKAMPDIVENSGAIAFGEPTWSKGKASVAISTNTKYTIQYQVGSTTGS